MSQVEGVERLVDRAGEVEMADGGERRLGVASTVMVNVPSTPVRAGALAIAT